MGGGRQKPSLIEAAAVHARGLPYRRAHLARLRAEARAWHVRMKPHFDRIHGYAPCGCAAHAGEDKG